MKHLDRLSLLRVLSLLQLFSLSADQTCLTHILRLVTEQEHAVICSLLQLLLVEFVLVIGQLPISTWRYQIIFDSVLDGH